MCKREGGRRIRRQTVKPKTDNSSACEVYQMPPKTAPTLPTHYPKSTGFKGQECSYITVWVCAQKEQSLRALKYIHTHTHTHTHHIYVMWMMKLATQWAQLEIISIMTTTTKPNKMQKALEICNSKLSIAYFWAPQCQYWRTRTPHTHRHTITLPCHCVLSLDQNFYPHIPMLALPLSRSLSLSLWTMYVEGLALFFNEIYD